jgi:hypothetical protein
MNNKGVFTVSLPGQDNSDAVKIKSDYIKLDNKPNCIFPTYLKNGMYITLPGNPNKKVEFLRGLELQIKLTEIEEFMKSQNYDEVKNIIEDLYEQMGTTFPYL